MSWLINFYLTLSKKCITVHSKLLKVSIKYKELENLAMSEKTKWLPEGTINLYAVASGKGSLFWIVRVGHNKKRFVITKGVGLKQKQK